MLVSSGLNTVFCSTSSVIVIIAATGEESPPEVDDAEVESIREKMDPSTFPPIIDADSEKLTIATNDER